MRNLAVTATIVLAVTLAATVPTRATADGTLDVIPSGTTIRFHLVAPLSSNDSKTGQAFSFVLIEPVANGDHIAAAQGAVGTGTVVLAGHAGSAGHEGDLTLRIDSVPTTDGRSLNFADQRFEVNGRNRKIQSGVLGLVPFVGLGARLIRGSDVRVDENAPLETILLRPATIANAAPALQVPLPTPSPAPTPTP